MITVDRETWDRWNETGEWSLFQAGEFAQIMEPDGTLLSGTIPPIEFVEWAQPCETCGGKHPGPTVTNSDHWNCIDFAPPLSVLCLDGKRRIAVTVPCPKCHPFNGDPADDGRCQTCGIKYHCVRCGHPCNLMATGHGPDLCEPHDGLVTVGHVVREWGPLVVMTAETFDGAPVALIAEAGVLYLRTGPAGDGTYEPITLPPGVDPATLVGQYAIGGKVVKP